MLSQQIGDGPAEGSELTENAGMLGRLRNGDDAAFEVMVRKFGPRLLAVARRYLRSEDDACDAVQDAFLCAFKSIRSFRGDSKLLTWLYRIVINSALILLREKSKLRLDETPAEVDELLPHFDGGGNWIVDPSCVAPMHTSLEVAETRSMVRRSIDKLPDAYRVVLILRDIDELHTSEIASLMDLTENNVRTRLYRGRRALKTLIEREQCL